MDLRIVNTCDNDCLYCLESSLRKKDKFISKDLLYGIILKEKKRNNITFFGGNPLLHPDILEIIKFCKINGYIGIGILSNSNGVNKEFLLKLISEGLDSFGIYFNSFDKNNHELVNGGGISYKIFLENLNLISKLFLNLKVIIHINNQNIKTINRDIFLLNKKYNIVNFEFINYFPFDRPYDKFQKLLEYNILKNRQNIDNFFKVINILQINVKFVKFSKDFFGKNIKYFNFTKGILEQIGEEDIVILNGREIPFCKKEIRCNSCFLKYKCKWYEI